VKFYTGGVLKKIVDQIYVWFKSDKNNILHEDLRAFKIYRRLLDKQIQS
jgi:hypothetical protein